MRHLISHCLPRRQLGCAIFISILYTPSIISKRHLSQSLTSLIVCLHSRHANCPLLIFPLFPPTRKHACWGAGHWVQGYSFYLLLQRPISQTSTLRAAGVSCLARGGDGGRVSVTKYPIYPLLQERCVLQRTLHVASNRTHLFPAISSTSESWLPYQLNQDPNTLYHEASVRFHQLIFIRLPRGNNVCGKALQTESSV